MAEIKSTMDIIMEKTKGLTLTEEERRKIGEEEARRKVNGLVQRYLDGRIDMAKVTEEVGPVPEVRREFFLQEMKRNLLERIDPALDHGPILSLLASLPGVDVGALQREIERFRTETRERRRLQEKALLDEFEERGIRGDAVVPNVEADPRWQGYLKEAKARFGERVGRMG